MFYLVVVYLNCKYSIDEEINSFLRISFIGLNKEVMVEVYCYIEFFMISYIIRNSGIRNFFKFRKV